MVIAEFQMKNKVGKPRFFQKIFLIVDTKFEVILGKLFLKISNTDILFNKVILMQKFYTTNEALSTTEQVQIINLRKFVIIQLDADRKTFMVYMAIWQQKVMAMDPIKKAQIKVQNGAQVRDLIFNKAPTEIPAEYSNYSNIFLVKNVAELLKYTKINDYAIELEEDKQSLFRPI